jgi:hypothetical protein
MSKSLPVLTCTLLFLAMLPATAIAQSEMVIEWNGIPGQIETTITADTLADGSQAHDVYVLEHSRIYLQIDELQVKNSFTVRGQTVPSDQANAFPATVQPFPGPDGTSRYSPWPPGAHFRMNVDDVTLTLDNLLFNGAMADGSGHVWGVVGPGGDNQTIKVEDNVWSGYQLHLTTGRNTSFHFNNSIYKSVPSYPGGVFFNGLFWGGGSWLGTIDSLTVTNSSIINTWGEALVVYEQVNYGLVDHTSFVNIIMNPIFFRGGNNMTFTNNLFYNTKIFGQSTYHYGLWGFEDEDDNPIRQTSGVMNIMAQPAPDTTAIAAGRNWDHLNRNITWDNNAWVNDEQVLAFWAEGPWEWEVTDEDGNTVTRRDTMLAPSSQNIFVGDTLRALMAADPTIREFDNVETTPTLELDPQYLKLMIDRARDFRDNEKHDTFLDEWWQYEADNNPVNVQWPIHEDLRYSADSPAATASETGGPVGDPRWAPVPVSAEEDVLPNTFALHQNYPNPFNPSTEITFSLDEPSDVKLVIYNILGQAVRELASGSMTAGSYKYRWDGRNDVGLAVTSGLYIYTLSTGSRSVSRKMILVK